jgi:hypothetical protein
MLNTFAMRVNPRVKNGNILFAFTEPLEHLPRPRGPSCGPKITYADTHRISA